LALRDSDMVARVGGDEFAALLSVTEAGGGVTAAERVAEALRTPVALGAGVVHVEASIGIACWPDHGTDSETLLLHADQAMYTAKNSGVPLYLYDQLSGAPRPPGVERRSL
jgi:diguanylate cyclase (GGDEF)-like protein